MGSVWSRLGSDVLEEENLIRHVCGRRYLGQRKTDALADVLIDRNPAAKVDRYDVDLMSCTDLEDHVWIGDFSGKFPAFEQSATYSCDS